MTKKIESALISVFHKEGLEDLVRELLKNNVQIYSTGGTLTYLEGLGANPIPVEDLTSYPSILGGRVKTLHPKVFGGILSRRDKSEDIAQMETFEIPSLDLVVVDLYPFEETVKQSADHADIIEKIDIGGVSLIRAAAKNYQDVVVVPSKAHYQQLAKTLANDAGNTNIYLRKELAAAAFRITSHYDSLIGSYLAGSTLTGAVNSRIVNGLRYGENPHQPAEFHGDLDSLFDQLSGKQLSYNNLLDIDAAMLLMHDCGDHKPCVAILKHNNACGLSFRDTLAEAYAAALAGDPVSAFGGIIICNRNIDVDTAEQINNLFFEVLIAPDFDEKALHLLMAKKNRILLRKKAFSPQQTLFRTALNGTLVQQNDNKVEQGEDLKLVSKKAASRQEISDLLIANILVKNTKSNAIVLVKNAQLIGSGTGQTSRVDALNQALVKAKSFGFDTQDSVMASDAFFPFPDCVEIAHKSGIGAVIQPGGSIKDQLSIDFCDAHNMAMVFTGNRHFKH